MREASADADIGVDSARAVGIHQHDSPVASLRHPGQRGAAGAARARAPEPLSRRRRARRPTRTHQEVTAPRVELAALRRATLPKYLGTSLSGAIPTNTGRVAATRM